jgi:hypothetical protein
MANLLNTKVAYLTLKDGTVINRLLGLQSVKNQNVEDATLGFEKTQVGFAQALLDTTKRVIPVQITAAAILLPAAGTMDVSAELAGTAVSAAAPTFDAPSRTWTNLGAATYVGAGADAGNKVMLRAPGPAGQPDGTDPIKDANGNEVYARLSNAGGPNGAWTLTFYHAPGGVEAPYTLPGATTAYAWFRQWVPGSSQLLEDQGRVIISSPGAVDINENNNIQQLAADLGVTLSNNGAASLARSVIQRIADHVGGITGPGAERHSTIDIDVEVADGVVVSGLGANATLKDALNQLQTNVTAASGAAQGNLEQYFNDLRSNGVLGTAATLIDNGDNTAQPAAGRFAYVAGKRFAIPVAPVAVPDGTSLFFWVDNTGAVQTGLAYPGAGEFTKLGKATAAGGVISFSALPNEAHRPLVELDQKVIDLETLLTTHIASTAAHALEDLTFDPTGTNLTNPDNSPVANGQEAIVALDRRIDAIEFGFHRYTIQAGDIAGATPAPAIGANVAYFEVLIPGAKGTYIPGRNLMAVLVDGDPQDPLAEYNGAGNGYEGVFTEPANDRVRIHFDTTVPLEAGMKISLRWLKTTAA